MSEHSKATDVILTRHYSNGIINARPKGNPFLFNAGNVMFEAEYVSRDHCNELVAAAYEAAKDRMPYTYGNYREVIQALTPADAQAAYDAALSAARSEALTEAMALFTKDETLSGCVVLHRLEKLRGKSDG